MNLVWHIVKKDIRALKWPLLLWVMVIVAKLGLGVVLLTADGTEGAGWFTRMDALTKMLTALEFVSFVLTAAVVQQDLLVGSTAFWMTRPISGGRLLCAKILCLGLAFGAVPVLVTLPWWLGCGYGADEIAWAVAETVMVQTIAVLLGLLWSVVTDGYARFLMWTLVTLFAIPTLTGTLAYYASQGQPKVMGDVVGTRTVVIFVLALLGIHAVVVHQFLTRRTGRSLGIISGTVSLIIAVGAWWPWSWDLQSRFDSWLAHRTERHWPVTAEPAGLKFTLEPAQLNSQRPGSRPDRPFPHRVKYRVEGLTETQGLIPSVADQTWHWSDGTTFAGRGWGRTGFSEMVREKALGWAMNNSPDGQYTDTVTMSGSVPPAIAVKMQAEPSVYTLKARLTLMQFISATPVPLQSGDRSLQGVVGERIAGVEKSGENFLVTFIRHYPAFLVNMDGFGPGVPFGYFTQYVLVNRAHDFVDRGRIEGQKTRVATVAIDWQTIAYRASPKAGGPRPLLEAINALEGAELIKVNFVRKVEFTHEFKVDAYTAELVNP